MLMLLLVDFDENWTRRPYSLYRLMGVSVHRRRSPRYRFLRPTLQNVTTDWPRRATIAPNEPAASRCDTGSNPD